MQLSVHRYPPGLRVDQSLGAESEALPQKRVFPHALTIRAGEYSGRFPYALVLAIPIVRGVWIAVQGGICTLWTSTNGSSLNVASICCILELPNRAHLPKVATQSPTGAPVRD